MTRDVSFDEEVAERDPETQECFADVRPMQDLQEARARWAALFDKHAKGGDEVAR